MYRYFEIKTKHVVDYKKKNKFNLDKSFIVYRVGRKLKAEKPSHPYCYSVLFVVIKLIRDILSYKEYFLIFSSSVDFFFYQHFMYVYL